MRPWAARGRLVGGPVVKSYRWRLSSIAANVKLNRRLVLVIASTLLALALSGWLAHRLAVERLRSAVAGALGPRASVAATTITWRGVELQGLRIAAGAGWPAADELRAERVLVTPDLRSLWSALSGGPWRVRSVHIDAGYVSLHRTRDGTLRVLPALLRAGAGNAGADARAPQVIIGSVRLERGAVDVFDSSVRGPTHRVRLSALDAEVGPLHLPALAVPIDIDLEATLNGQHHDGRLTVRGELTPATRDAKISVKASAVDLIALQPYLLRINESGVSSGRLDLDLDARVQRTQLRAPGVVTLTQLELAPGSGVLGSIAGVPRQAVLGAMSRDGRIVVRFTLEGRLDDPAFSLNENFATKIGSGLAEVLGVSVSGVVEGVGKVIKGLFGR